MVTYGWERSSKKEKGDFVSCLSKKGKKQEGNGHGKNKLREHEEWQTCAA